MTFPKTVDSSYVAEALGITTGTVLALMRKGLLTDINPVNPSHKKHFSKFDRADVKRLVTAMRPYKRAARDG